MQSHLQRVESRIRDDQFPIHDEATDRQHGHCRRHFREEAGEGALTARLQLDGFAAAKGYTAEAVIFWLEYPAGPVGQRFDGLGLHRRERERYWPAHRTRVAVRGAGGGVPGATWRACASKASQR